MVTFFSYISILVLKTDNLYILNGRWSIERSKVVYAAGTRIKYDINKIKKETIYAEGPLKSDLFVMVT